MQRASKYRFFYWGGYTKSCQNFTLKLFLQDLTKFNCKRNITLFLILVLNCCHVVFSDDTGADKKGPGATEGAESGLGNDGLLEKFGKSSACPESVM